MSRHSFGRAINMTFDRIGSLGTGCFVIALVSGCGGGRSTSIGYQKSGGEWVYVTSDAGNGRVVHQIKGADTPTFEVLSADNYARDKQHVYFKMHRLDNADPSPFVVVSDDVYVYGKDRYRSPCRCQDIQDTRQTHWHGHRQGSHISRSRTESGASKQLEAGAQMWC